MSNEFKFVSHIGIELEGGWDSTPTGVRPDGSLRNINGASCIGEVASPPIDNFSELEEYVKKFCPKYVNESCGLHIHVSFKSSSHYLTLMEDKFYKYFLARMKDFGTKMEFPTNHLFWNRYEGKNKFCINEFYPERQINLNHKDSIRYTHLNYCYTLHKTIECRMFPAFNDVDTIMSTIKELVNCYELYLSYNSANLINQIEEFISEDELVEMA